MPPREEILTKLKGVDAVLWGTGCRLDTEALDAAGPQLKAISVKSAGFDFVDLAELKRRGIPLGNTPGVLNSAVANVAVGLLLAASRRFHEGYMAIVRDEWMVWDTQWMIGPDIERSTVGIVGLGGIGQTIVQRLSVFGVAKFLYTGPREKVEGTFLKIYRLLRFMDSSIQFSK